MANPPTRRRRLLPWWLVASVAVVGTVVAAAAVAASVDGDALARAARAAARQPAGVAAGLGAFGLAFVVRAVAWQRVLPGLGFGQALAALHVTLGANHVLPLRLGEGLRVLSVVRRTAVTLPAAAASTVTLRSADILTCAAVAVAGSPAVAVRLLGGWGWAAVAATAVAATAGVAWTWRLRASGTVRLPGPLVVAASAAAWGLEAVLVLVTARWAGIDAGYADALLVVGTSVAAQVGAVTPGGFGTYEAAATAAWTAAGHDPATGLAAALAAHALKTAYSLVAGALGALWPAPGLAGRLRLAPGPTPTPGPPVPAAPGLPVVLFLPARDEAPRVAAVVRRAPDTVLGHPVRVVVVDDGSTDDTAAVAAGAGAEVVRLDRHRGLGAAVRRGLREGVARHAAAVVFCDADGEYAPEELERMVGPVLAGHADYVVGSRFAGDIRRMLPHRRAGNRLLTAALRFVARRPITDGQSGYRALSARAAAAAEIVHDFNYAQVLTLDLLGKGYAYREVPITYGFRESGRSFVRLGRYLRAVVPAVYRELNAA